MTDTNKFIYFENINVCKTRSGENYKVEYEEDKVIFYISERLVSKIIAQTNEDSNLIAIMLSSIEYARRSRNQVKNNKNREKKLEDDIIVYGTAALLQHYSVEYLIEAFQELKWHEIVEILSSRYPYKKIDEFI